jgi:hypothetical protein
MPVTRWERVVWTVQRMGWVLMGAVLVLALLGLLGGGGLNRRTVAASDGSATFTYERVMRLETPRELFWTAVPRSGRVLLDWNGAGCLVYTGEEPGPPPDRVQLLGAVQRFELSSPGVEPITVALGMRAERPGVCDVRTRANDGAWIARRILILP